MGEGSGGPRRARRWLARWLGHATVAESEAEVAPARPAGETPEAPWSMYRRYRRPRRHGSNEKRTCTRCGRVLRWALPLCWDCDAAAKKAGATERR